MWRFARTLTQTAVRYLGCPPKAWAGEPDRRITEALMGEIGDCGNFGRKQEGRFYESLLIASQEKRMVSRKSMGGQLIRSMNEMVRRRWPAAGRFPLLLPPGWIFLGRQISDPGGQREAAAGASGTDPAAGRGAEAAVQSAGAF